MAIFTKPKAKIVSVGRAKVLNAQNNNIKSKPAKPGKGGRPDRGVPKGGTRLYKHEPKQKD